MFYYVSIGTNINPSHNATAIIKELCLAFNHVILWPYCSTQPENITTDNGFLNSLAIFESDLPEKEVKARLNTIEILLGRDRSDPKRSMKDRTADIDILDTLPELNYEHFTTLSLPDYLHQVYDYNARSHVRPQLTLPSIERPTTVYFDRGTSHIRVIKQKLHG